MAHKTWSFELSGAPTQEGSPTAYAPARRHHTVDLNHNYWTNKRTISVDGVRLTPDRLTSYTNLNPFSQDGWGSDDLFKLDGHDCLVHIRSTGLTYKYDFAVDGRSLETDERVEPFPQIATPHLAARKMPGWAWGFVVLSFVLPLIATLLAILLLKARPTSNFFVTVIAFITIGIVVARSKDLTRPTDQRVRECAVSVFLAGCAAFGVATVFTLLFPRG